MSTRPITGFLMEVPVLPDEGQGRSWAERELARSEYQEAQPSLLDRFWSWLGGFFSDLLDGLSGVDPTLGVVLLAAGAAAVLAVAVYLVRPRLNARRRKDVFDSEDAREAVDHRKLAEEAADRGEWDTALAERLRAVIRSAEERVILELRAGRTAAEAGQDLATAFPGEAPEILWLARRFDEVRYGRLPAAAADAEKAAALDLRLESSTPAPSGTAPAALAAPR